MRINEIKEAFAYLADVVDDIQWDSRLSHLNHVTHFPYYLTFFVVTVPIACFAGIFRKHPTQVCWPGDENASVL